MKKNTFKILDKRRERKKSPDKIERLLDVRVKEKEGFCHIPAEAFYSIYMPNNEYSHLKNGLYVAEEQLKYDDRTAEGIEPFIRPRHHFEHRNPVYGFNFLEYRQILKNLDSVMLSIAEFICMDDYIKKSDGFDWLNHNIKNTHVCEWLDNVYTKGRDLYIHPELGPRNGIKGEPVRIKQPKGEFSFLENRFDVNTSDPHTGFPKEFSYKGRYSFTYAEFSRNGFVWNHGKKIINFELDIDPDNTYGPDNNSTLCRECKIPTEEDIEYIK